jgi:hypothetical protein
MSDPGFHLAYGTVNADGTLQAGAQGLASWGIAGKAGRYALRFAEGGFVNPPAVILTPHGEDQREVRLQALEWHRERTKYDAAAKQLEAAGSESAKQKARQEMRAQFENRKVAVRAEAYDVFPDGETLAKARAGEPTPAAASFHVLAIARSGSLEAENPAHFFTGAIDPEGCELGVRTNTSALTTEDDVQIVAGILDCAERTLVKAYNGCSLDAAHTAVGSFKIAFGKAFDSPPVVLASLELTAGLGANPIRTVRIDEVTAGGVELLLGDGLVEKDGKTSIQLFDQGRIHFLAIGKGSSKTAGQLAYGVVERDGVHPAMHGDEYTATYPATATYRLAFDPPFADEPILVGTTEHVKKEHVRQFQIATAESRKDGAKIQVMGRARNQDTPARNTCRINFIAYAPATA